ncbi:hypothetical protein TPA0910_27370 [Streptomyces hygroscopicus subsp. sporocinereus]|uniref:Uncharacterized protein n=1 Tax=Streptomyces hygroscopicus TaxID=1912 RepID=A0ABQ3TY49_STRHY|nr:hypothetical protein TPA0910_27370 [Streptomyces hygroscopicus]
MRESADAVGGHTREEHPCRLGAQAAVDAERMRRHADGQYGHGARPGHATGRRGGAPRPATGAGRRTEALRPAPRVRHLRVTLVPRASAGSPFGIRTAVL